MANGACSTNDDDAGDNGAAGHRSNGSSDGNRLHRRYGYGHATTSSSNDSRSHSSSAKQASVHSTDASTVRCTTAAAGSSKWMGIKFYAHEKCRFQ